MRIKEIFAGLLIIVTLMSVSISAQKNNDKLPAINFKEYTLKNGLRVVLHQDVILIAVEQDPRT